VYWLIGTLLLVIAAGAVILGFDQILSNSTLDINIHDMYLVIEYQHLLIMFGLLIFYTVYLTRTLKHRFQNLIANTIFMFSGVGLILVFILPITMLHEMVEFRMPAEAEVFMHTTTHCVNPFQKFIDTLLTIEIILLIVVVFIGYKTFRNFKNERKETIHTAKN
jgi:hypothetical protein